MKKSISIYSLLLFIVPLVTLTICHQIYVSYAGVQIFPFIDGEVSVSLIGRQKYTIGIFKPSFLLYALISIFFYFKISNFFLISGIKNKLRIYGVLANFFLCIYIIALGQKDYENVRRLAIIFYITNMYINHIYLIRILKILQSKKIIRFNIIYLSIFYVIIFLMTILIIIGLPWVNPLFKYPDQLKNIVEWNYFFLMIVYYIPLSLIFYQLSDKVKT